MVLNIITARNVTDYLKKLKEEGKLVIVSTHIMSEAEKLCDRIGIIIDGQKKRKVHWRNCCKKRVRGIWKMLSLKYYKEVKGGSIK